MIIKEYSIPLHRKIGSCELKNTDSLRSDIYLKCNKNNNININENSFKTEIYNVQYKDNNLILYTNTTNILLTNKYLNDIPLYQKIDNINKDLINEVIEIIKTKVTENYFLESTGNFYSIYLNTDLKKLPSIEGLFIENVQEIGDSSLNIVSNVTIRRLKDRLKLTISIEEPETYSFKLGSKYLLEPKYYKNWIHFYECVYVGLDQKPIHVYNHSFNFVSKYEAYNIKDYIYLEYKDPYVDKNNILEDFRESRVFVNYTSYRSNLLIPTNYSEELYIYLNIENSPEMRTKNLVISIKELNASTLIPVLIKKPYSVNYEVISNNFTKTELRECNSEGYTLVQNISKNNKYSNPNDIRLTNTRVITTLDKVIKNEENYVSFISQDRNIVQHNDLNAITTAVINTTNKQFSTEIEQRLDNLNSFISDYRQGSSSNFPDKFKIYYVENSNGNES